jgi:hypothetical protein
MDLSEDNGSGRTGTETARMIDNNNIWKVMNLMMPLSYAFTSALESEVRSVTWPPQLIKGTV